MAADEKKEEVLTLFSVVKIGDYERPNRIAMAPMTRGRATEEHVPTEMMITYYSQRADCGLLITEGTGISQQGLGWYRAPGIWSDEMVEKWKPVTEAVHKKNGMISCQLWHLGRQAHSDVTGLPTVSASAIAINAQVTTNKGAKKDYEVPHALEEKEIEVIIKDYNIAASNAIKAGFDMVELHGANGYLIDQFLQSVTNKRDDKYGGDINKRLLFMQEAVNAAIEGVGGSENARKVGIRLSPNSGFGEMGSEDNLEQFDAAIEWLAQKGLGYIHVMDGIGMSYHKKTKEPYTLERGKNIMNKYDKNMILIGNVGYTKELANERIGNKHTDLIAFGKPFISNPDLVKRFKNNYPLAETAPYVTWWGWDHMENGYIDWPTYEEEQAKTKEENAKDDATH